MRCLVLISVFACALQAQDSSPTFEVASVKVAGPLTPSPGGAYKTGCANPDPAVFRCTSATFKTLIMRAYKVEAYQVEGPAWIDSERYDVTGKLPEDAEKDDIPVMLQGLLAQRFALKLHKETRDLPAYDLTIAKSGPKLKVVDTDKLPEQMGAMSNATLPPVSRMPVGAMVILFGESPTRMVRGNLTIDKLAGYLTTVLRRPVFDRTSLQGVYAIDLSYRPDEMESAGLTNQAELDAKIPNPSLFQALQETLGLKLEAKKAPGEMIVVDSASKVPTLN